MKQMRTPSLFVILVATAALNFSPVQASESYYRWTDKHGNPVHSDRPPPKGVDYEVITTGTSLVRKVDSDEGAVLAKKKSATNSSFDSGKASSVKPSPKNAEYCARAQENLRVLDSRANIRMRNDQGETYILTEEDKEEKRAEARSVIESQCE